MTREMRQLTISSRRPVAQTGLVVHEQQRQQQMIWFNNPTRPQWFPRRFAGSDQIVMIAGMMRRNSICVLRRTIRMQRYDALRA